MLNKTLFAQNMALLGTLYEKELTKILHDVYYEILKDMQDDDFRQAIRRLLSVRVYPTFPKPAEILELTSAVEEIKQIVDQDEIKAKELIELVQGMNGSVYQKHIESGINFDDLLSAAKFPTVSEQDIAILNQVRPHYDLKLLIGNINGYGNGSEQLQAFKSAVKYSNTDSSQISYEISKRLK